MAQSGGIHHVTAICADTRKNVAFYTQDLGLRLVKKTVNFDDPGTWHLYYGDETGSPGTALTFFAWPMAARGAAGPGMAAETAFAIPFRSLDYWAKRLAERGIGHDEPIERFGQRVLPFADPDGMRFALVGSESVTAQPGWSNGDVPADHAIRGFHGVTLTSRAAQRTAEVLTGAFGFRLTGREGGRERFEAVGAGPGAAVDLLADPARAGRTSGRRHSASCRLPCLR